MAKKKIAEKEKEDLVPEENVKQENDQGQTSSVEDFTPPDFEDEPALGDTEFQNRQQELEEILNPLAVENKCIVCGTNIPKGLSTLHVMEGPLCTMGCARKWAVTNTRKNIAMEPKG